MYIQIPTVLELQTFRRNGHHRHTLWFEAILRLSSPSNGPAELYTTTTAHSIYIYKRVHQYLLYRIRVHSTFELFVRAEA